MDIIDIRAKSQANTRELRASSLEMEVKERKDNKRDKNGGTEAFNENNIVIQRLGFFKVKRRSRDPDP